MVKLKVPVNRNGVIIEAGTTVTLPVEFEDRIIKAGLAEKYSYEPSQSTEAFETSRQTESAITENHASSGAVEKVIPETAKEEKPDNEKPIDKMTKAELLEFAAKLGVTGVSEVMTKAEIQEAIIDAQHGEQENPEKDDE